MSYAPYPAYKDSGVPWVGAIPSTWDTQPFFMMADPNKQKNTGGLETNLLSLSHGRIIRKDIKDNSGLLPESFDTYQIVYKGQVVFRLTDLQNDKVSLRSALVREKGIITSAYLAIQFKGLDSDYAGYLMRSYDKSMVFYEMGGGVRQSGKFEDLKWMPVVVPPIEEQAIIAKFLDDKTAEIDALISKKEELLKLLAEQRSALITQAVTKGLNPNAPMKPSGIEWLGDVPEGWDILQLRYIAKSIIGLTYSPNDVIDEGEGTLVLRSTNIQNGIISLHNNVYVSSNISEKLKTQKGDILICSRNGSRKLIGKNALISESDKNLSFGAFTTVVRSEYGNFLYWILNSRLFEYQSSRFLTSTINQLTVGVLNSFEIPLPPNNEQKKICEYLNDKVNNLNDSSKKIQQAINHLKEYRTALITNAVTGKIKVS